MATKGIKSRVFFWQIFHVDPRGYVHVTMLNPPTFMPEHSGITRQIDAGNH